ncbi:MAG: hypothetical protein ACM34D_00335, partial [Gemmatimonadota bacterium]
MDDGSDTSLAGPRRDEPYVKGDWKRTILEQAESCWNERLFSRHERSVSGNRVLTGDWLVTIRNTFGGQ